MHPTSKRSGTLPILLVAPILLWSCDAVPSGPDVEADALLHHAPGHERGGGGGDGGGDGGSTSDAPLVVTHLTEDDAVSAGNRIWGDGQGDYVDGACGVEAILRQEFGNDATVDPDANWKKSLDCGPRTITVDLSQPADGGEAWPAETGGWFMNVNDVADVAMADGAVEVPAQFNPDACPRGLRFEAAEGGSDVEVEQTSEGIWEVASKAPHTAVCREVRRGNKVVQPERLFTVPFRLTLSLKK